MLPPFGRPLAPLPPLLARLHALLEAHAEATEEGVLIIEQDRRPGADPTATPVIVFVPARPRPEAATGRAAPELIAEVVVPGGEPREARYARAGVREYWRVEPRDPGPPRVVVATDPDGEAGRFRARASFEGVDLVRSGVLPDLALRPADLVAGDAPPHEA
ncbi:MAG: Uma2 family endonuclease [Planctomycetes bacterium]|nr:Uma2 family endonuclease [Planctomycetota bacterium]